jgi:tRNA A-37 threonylcarbamoyl transferase component Bud32
MHSDWTGSSSSDVVLRCYAPPLLSEPYRHVVSGWGSARDKLSRRLGFLETLLRYLVAIYGAELDEPESGPYRVLQKQLAKPSLGVWWNAADSLARAVAVKKNAVAPELAEILVDTFGGTRPSPTPVSRKLRQLIEVRNLSAHLEGAIMPSEDEASSLLAEIRGPLRTVLHGLSPLRGYPLLAIEDIKAPAWTKVLRFTPAGIDCFELGATRLAMDKRQVFLVSKRGDVLCLDPWLRLEERAGTCRAVLRNPRHKEDLKVLESHLPRQGAVLRGVYSPTNAERLRGASPSAGQPQIPGYAIDGLLGRGGAGSVWMARAEQMTSTERVAVKVLHRASVADSQARERLKREYDFLARRPHPAVVGARDWGESDSDGPYLVMEYIQGMDLESKLRVAPLDPDEAARIVMEVLDALAATHAHGQVHRDIKPANLILDPQGHVRLIDFGIAAAPGVTRLTRTLQAVGTRDYMAPEQLSGAEADARTDLYALGRTLEDLVRGIGAVEERPKLPPGLVAVVRKATQDKPSDRFQTALEMKAALQERHQASWGGAPVMERDRLNDSFGLVSAMGRLAEQAWLFEGRMDTGEPVGLLLATGGAAAMLYAAHAEVTKELRHRLDYLGLFQTADAGGNRYPFIVFSGITNLEERVGELLGDGRYSMLTGRARRVLPPVAPPPPAPAPGPAPEPTPEPVVDEPAPVVEPDPPALLDGGGPRKEKKKAVPTAAVIGVLAGGALAGVAGAIGGAVVGSQIAKQRKQAAKAKRGGAAGAGRKKRG